MTKMLSFLRCRAMIVVSALVAICSVAAADTTGDPLGTAQTSADGFVSTISTYGPVIGGMYLAYSIMQSLLARYGSSSWLAQGKRLAIATSLLGIVGAALQAQITGSTWTVVLAAAVAAAFKLRPPTVSGAAPKPSSSLVNVVTIGVLLLAVGVLGGQPGCGPKTSAIAHDIWTNCLAPERAEAVAVFTPIAESAILAAASADGSLIDTSKLRAAISGANLLTEAGILLNCAMASAVTALLTPTPETSGASPLVLDPAALRSSWAQVAPPGARFRTQHGDL